MQDDLYRHVNGTWLAETEIPADKSITGSFIALRDAAEQAVREIITELGRRRARRAASAPRSPPCTRASSTSSGSRPRVDPAGPAHGRVDAVSDSGGADGTARRLHPGRHSRVDRDRHRVRPGRPEPLRDVRRPGRSRACPTRSTTGSTTTPRSASSTSTTSPGCWSWPGSTDPAAAARQVFELETDIAAHHWDKVKCRDMRLMYNLMDLAAFEAAAPALHWRRFMSGADISEPAMAELVVTQPSFCTEVGALLTADRLPAWRAWARWRAVSALAPVPVERLRGRELPLLRHGPARHPRAQGALETRRRPRRGCAGRGGRPAVRGAALLPGGQAADGRSGRQPHRGLPPLDHRAGLDDGEDEDRGAGQAGEVPAAHRLSEQVAGLLGVRGAAPTTWWATSCGPRPSSWTAR